MPSPRNVLLCLAHGSEEMEAVTIADLLARADIQVTLASAESNGDLTITGSRNIRLVCDGPLAELVDQDYDALVLPGGMPGTETLSDSLLVTEAVRQFHGAGKIVAAICAAPALIFAKHALFPMGNMTCFPALKAQIPERQWKDRRVVWDPRYNLLTSQGPGTAIDFSLKIIELLKGKETAQKVAADLVLAVGIYNYQDYPASS